MLACVAGVGSLTDHTAEQAQAGGVTLTTVSGIVLPGRWQRDAEADRAVELPSARLHRDNGAEGRLVPQQFSDQLIGHGLRLWATQAQASGPVCPGLGHSLSPLPTPTCGSPTVPGVRISGAHLQGQPHSLGDSGVWEGGLYHGHQCALQTPSLGADQIAVLANPGHDHEVEREVGGDDAADPLLLQLLQALQLCKGSTPINTQIPSPRLLPTAPSEPLTMPRSAPSHHPGQLQTCLCGAAWP